MTCHYVLFAKNVLFLYDLQCHMTVFINFSCTLSSQDPSLGNRSQYTDQTLNPCRLETNAFSLVAIGTYMRLST